MSLHVHAYKSALYHYLPLALRPYFTCYDNDYYLKSVFSVHLYRVLLLFGALE